MRRNRLIRLVTYWANLRLTTCHLMILYSTLLSSFPEIQILGELRSTSSIHSSGKWGPRRIEALPQPCSDYQPGWARAQSPRWFVIFPPSRSDAFWEQALARTLLKTRGQVCAFAELCDTLFVMQPVHLGERCILTLSHKRGNDKSRLPWATGP